MVEQPPAALAVSVFAGIEFIPYVSWARVVVESVSTTWTVRLESSSGHQLCMDGCVDHDCCAVYPKNRVSGTCTKTLLVVNLVRRRLRHTGHLVELLYLAGVWKERHVDLGGRLVDKLDMK